jgi:hypothetical protein
MTDDVYAVLRSEFESCFICGAMVERLNGSLLNEAWHRRLEGEDVSPP